MVGGIVCTAGECVVFDYAKKLGNYNKGSLL